MKAIKPWLVILLVFATGFVGGIVVTRVVVRHVVQATIANPDRLRDLLERRITVRLKLDAAQRVEVHRILSTAQSEMKELRRDVAPRFLTIVSNAESEISRSLTAEQREKFEKLQEENRRIWRVPPPVK
jgi:hypothetical protein